MYEVTWVKIYLELYSTICKFWVCSYLSKNPHIYFLKYQSALNSRLGFLVIAISFSSPICLIEIFFFLKIDISQKLHQLSLSGFRSITPLIFLYSKPVSKRGVHGLIFEMTYFGDLDLEVKVTKYILNTPLGIRDKILIVSFSITITGFKKNVTNRVFKNILQNTALLFLNSIVTQYNKR